MSRRLTQMTEEAVQSGDSNAAKAVKESGFSEDLIQQLERKISGAQFRSDNASAISQANLPPGAGKDAKAIASSVPWGGAESMEDASLRMLHDSHKPLRTTTRLPPIRGPAVRMDPGRASPARQPGVRLANARDQSSIYAISKDVNLSQDERDRFREEMKQRFQPGARSIPATVQGLASLANKRIEDAIARGQFKNLPRGQVIERDHNASSPFINTTEYFMNKMIQRQEIVPPWIEKQQEVASTASKFRTRLRADWKRHVARTIASRGGSLDDQMRLADEYARAESVHGTWPRPSEADTTSAAAELRLPSSEKGSTSRGPRNSGASNPVAAAGVEITTLREASEAGPIQSDLQSHVENDDSAPLRSPHMLAAATVTPFRDLHWEQTERAYHSLAIENLNSLTRSYNLMAPDLAKKPYFSLERELRLCFAEVAPQVAGAIRDRALAPKVKAVEVDDHRSGGILNKFTMSPTGRVYDETRPQYGFKEFWRDLFSARKSSR